MIDSIELLLLEVSIDFSLEFYQLTVTQYRYEVIIHMSQLITNPLLRESSQSENRCKTMLIRFGNVVQQQRCATLQPIQMKTKRQLFSFSL